MHFCAIQTKLNQAIAVGCELDLAPFVTTTKLTTAKMTTAESTAIGKEAAKSEERQCNSEAQLPCDSSTIDLSHQQNQNQQSPVCETKACEPYTKYELTGVLMHQGTPRAGHYYAYTRLGYQTLPAQQLQDNKYVLSGDNSSDMQRFLHTKSSSGSISASGNSSNGGMTTPKLSAEDFRFALVHRWGCFVDYIAVRELAQVAMDARSSVGAPMEQAEQQECINTCADFLKRCNGGEGASVQAVITELCSADEASVLTAILYPSRWVKFDDSRVSNVDVTEVLAQASGGGGAGASPYMLFYAREDQLVATIAHDRPFSHSSKKNQVQASQQPNSQTGLQTSLGTDSTVYSLSSSMKDSRDYNNPRNWFAVNIKCHQLRFEEFTGRYELPSDHYSDDVWDDDDDNKSNGITEFKWCLRTNAGNIARLKLTEIACNDKTNTNKIP